ncbi:TRAP transporter large permease [Terasakiella pusilla]|jgi:tripartite ATP-independent transporter DctM subunit|uniref:TRAP transporter large permease n=1 Tax=Terasakiella pusilla TaxID=64973 RepID=UPI0004905FC2|nr:TRAP transporter large permease [Terasakiella pusilla]
MTPIEVGITGLGALVLVICLHVPVGIAMAVVGAGGFLVLTGSWSGMFSLFGTETVSMLTNQEFSVVMTFLLMGGFAGIAGLSGDIYKLANVWIGHYRGGLAMATIAGCGGFGAISGSSIATTATMTRIAMPEMEKRNYLLSLCSGTLAAGGTLGSLIPPSIIMVIYAVQVEQFVIDMFLAAVMPGLLSIFLFFIAIRVYLMMNPSAAEISPRAEWAERLKVTRKSWGASAIIIVVMGGIYSGIFTVNEGAAVGLVMTLAFAYMRGALKGQAFWATIYESAGSIALLYLIMLGANIFTYFMTLSHMPQEIVEWVKSFDIPPMAIILMLVAMYVVLGAVFDALAGMVLTLPFVFPLVTGLGFDPIWWGIINVMVIEIGMITPPVGINVFVLKSLRPEIPLSTIYKGVLPFLIANIVALFLVLFFPEIALWLPNALR